VQVLNTRYVRRLITMEKACPYDADAAAAWRTQLGSAPMPMDSIHETVYHSRITREERAQKKKRFRGKVT
jgi:hypothetical protein